MPNFSKIHFELQTTDGKPFLIKISLALLDQSKYTAVLQNLSNAEIIKSPIGYAKFTALDGQLLVQQQNGENILQSAIVITFNLLDAPIVFPELVKLLSVIGVGLEPTEVYNLKKDCLRMDDEHFYLNAALVFIKKMRHDHVDSLLFIETQRLIRELPIEFKISFAVKIAKIFMACNMNNCALNTLVLYSSHPECKTIANDLRVKLDAVTETTTPKPIKFNPVKVAAIIAAPKFSAKHSLTHIHAIFDENIKGLIFTLGTQAANTELYNFLTTNNTVLIKGRSYSYKVQEIYAGAPPVKQIFVSFARELQYQIFDHLLIQLAKAGYNFMEAERGIVRMGLGFVDIDHIVQFFPAIIAQMTKDSPDSFMYRWLESICFEVSAAHRFTFIINISNHLKEAGFPKCATNLTANLQDTIVYQAEKIFRVIPMLAGLALHTQATTNPEENRDKAAATPGGLRLDGL